MGQRSDLGFSDFKSQMPSLVDIPGEETKILDFWRSHDAFKTSLKHSSGKRRFTFYDGPPFATGLPHYGHLLAGTIKDIVTRYAHQRGHHVERSFPLDNDPETSMIAWTTTPWTLVSNLALCMHPDKEYVKILDTSKNRKFIMMKARLTSVYKQENEYKVLDTFKGRSMEGLTYQPPFSYFIHLKKERGAFRILCDTYVTEDVGTGVVHQAPYFGEFVALI
ncbi:unnamed protein product [Schistosoma mattheei]|uniref:Uncharacterized protein n=1 Tax=Schistosoma mattheei TaxID=31246 RepID=A0A183PHD8_9TREM|nr:unnamed protein product [Schistosoma mattheei]